LLRLLPLLLLLVVIPLGMVSTTGALLEGSVHTKVYSAHDYLATQARIHLTYARLVLFPVNLTLDYGYPVYRSFMALPVLASLGAIGAFFAMTVLFIVRASRNRRTYAIPAFGMAFYILAHSVESSFVSIVEIISEHRIYLPLPGLLLAAIPLFTGAALRTGRKRAMRVLWAAALALALVLAAATIARNARWGDPLAFWEDAVRKSPDNWRALTYLGQTYRERGMLEKAVRTLERAAATITTERLSAASTYVSLGRAYAELGDSGRALAAYEKALAIFPSYDTLIETAHAQTDLGLYDKAVASASRAVEAMPGNPEAYGILGIAASYAGRYAEAFAAFDRALALDPEYDAARYNRALASLEAGDRARAELEYETLIARGSSFAAPLGAVLEEEAAGRLRGGPPAARR
jgi:tetratricopeptide (TPR) repeat protein